MIETIELLKQLLVIWSQIMLLIILIGVTTIFISAVIRALKSKEWGGGM
jgi:hypothetical protein